MVDFNSQSFWCYGDNLANCVSMGCVAKRRFFELVFFCSLNLSLQIDRIKSPKQIKLKGQLWQFGHSQ